MNVVAFNSFTEDSNVPSVPPVGSFVASARRAVSPESSFAVATHDWQERTEELLAIFDIDHPTTSGSFDSFLF